MTYEKLMQLKDIYFEQITEPLDNSLKLFFSRSFTSATPESIMIGDKQIDDLYSIDIDTSLPIIQIEFDTYIGYSFRNESFTTLDEYEEFEGKAFRIYKKSRFLDFIQISTFADQEFPGPFSHYGMSCLNHVIDIVSMSEPTVTEITRN